MKKFMTLAFTILLAASVSSAQAVGGPPKPSEPCCSAGDKGSAAKAKGKKGGMNQPPDGAPAARTKGKKGGMNQPPDGAPAASTKGK